LLDDFHPTPTASPDNSVAKLLYVFDRARLCFGTFGNITQMVLVHPARGAGERHVRTTLAKARMHSSKVSAPNRNDGNVPIL
jgi:hypothetical protein